LNRPGSICCHPHHLQVRVASQEHAKALTHEAVVVYNQHANPHRCSSFRVISNPLHHYRKAKHITFSHMDFSSVCVDLNDHHISGFVMRGFSAKKVPERCLRVMSSEGEPVFSFCCSSEAVINSSTSEAESPRASACTSTYGGANSGKASTSMLRSWVMPTKFIATARATTKRPRWGGYARSHRAGHPRRPR